MAIACNFGVARARAAGILSEMESQMLILDNPSQMLEFCRFLVMLIKESIDSPVFPLLNSFLGGTGSTSRRTSKPRSPTSAVF